MVLVESVPRSRSSLATPASDSELVTRVAAGDAAAFTTLMRRHNRQLFRTARSILKCDAEAEDAVQDAYLRAWRAIDGFRSEAKLSTWLVRIVINESLGRLRRARSAQAVMLEPGGEPTREPAPAHPLDDHADHQPEGVAMRSEMRGLLEASIDRLPDGFRSVFILRAVEEMSVDDVAAPS